MEIRRLTAADVPDATALSTQAGWNQNPADWRRLLALAPEGCFAGWVDDDLVATSTLVTYDGSVGWIGMVLVDEAHRRKGFGTRIFEAALDAARERDVPGVGLDATDAGREVYRRIDFVDVAPITRWQGTLDAEVAGVAAPDAPAAARDPALDAIRTLDRRACGIDRGEFLDRLLGESEAFALGVPGADGLDGYAAVRPGREHWQVGPVVADDAEALAPLLAAAADELGDASVIVDSLDESGTAALERAGLNPRRRLTRMAYREAAPLLMGTSVVAAAGFEWG